MSPWGPTKGNGQLTRQNEFFHINQATVLFNKETLKFNDLVQKVCMFLRKETYIAKTARRWVPRDPKSIFLATTFT